MPPYFRLFPDSVFSFIAIFGLSYNSFEETATISSLDLSIRLQGLCRPSPPRPAPAPTQPPLPLTPRHRVSASLVYEAESKWKAEVESLYTSPQTLDNGQTARDYWTFDVMVQRSRGHWGLSVNVENLTDTRQSRFRPMFTGTEQAPVFSEVYAPVEGRIVSVALRYTK